MSVNERTYIMVKVCYFSTAMDMISTCFAQQPDGVQRGLVGEIIKRFEARGFKLVALKMVHATPEHLEKRTSFPQRIALIDAADTVIS